MQIDICVHIKHTMTKSAALRIRIGPELHHKFLHVCKRLDVPAAQVLRQHMRKFVEENRNDMQDNLFIGRDNSSGDQTEDRGK